MQSQGMLGARDLRDGALQQCVLDIEQRHAPAFGEKALGGRKPNSARGSGDEGDFRRGGRHTASMLG
jgi:hypothetical protein